MTTKPEPAMRVRTGALYRHAIHGATVVITVFHDTPDGVALTVEYQSGIASDLTERMTVAEFRNQFCEA